jgi:hypothetical protein
MTQGGAPLVHDFLMPITADLSALSGFTDIQMEK